MFLIHFKRRYKQPSFCECDLMVTIMRRRWYSASHQDVTSSDLIISLMVFVSAFFSEWCDFNLYHV